MFFIVIFALHIYKCRVCFTGVQHQQVNTESLLLEAVKQVKVSDLEDEILELPEEDPSGNTQWEHTHTHPLFLPSMDPLINPSIPSSIHSPLYQYLLSISPLFHPPTHQSVHLSVYCSIHTSLSNFIHQSNIPSILSSIHQYIHQAVTSTISPLNSVLRRSVVQFLMERWLFELWEDFWSTVIADGSIETLNNSTKPSEASVWLFQPAVCTGLVWRLYISLTDFL